MLEFTEKQHEEAKRTIKESLGRAETWIKILKIYGLSNKEFGKVTGELDFLINNEEVPNEVRTFFKESLKISRFK